MQQPSSCAAVAVAASFNQFSNLSGISEHLLNIYDNQQITKALTLRLTFVHIDCFSLHTLHQIRRNYFGTTSLVCFLRNAMTTDLMSVLPETEKRLYSNRFGCSFLREVNENCSEVRFVRKCKEYYRILFSCDMFSPIFLKCDPSSRILYS